jgi:serine/threonine protein kinase
VDLGTRAQGLRRAVRSSDRGGRKLTLRILQPEFLVSLAADQFLREMHLASRLNHPHIARLDSGERDWLIYLIMPFIEGPACATC